MPTIRSINKAFERVESLAPFEVVIPGDSPDEEPLIIKGELNGVTLGMLRVVDRDPEVLGDMLTTITQEINLTDDDGEPFATVADAYNSLTMPSLNAISMAIFKAVGEKKVSAGTGSSGRSSASKGRRSRGGRG